MGDMCVICAKNVGEDTYVVCDDEGVWHVESQ